MAFENRRLAAVLAAALAATSSPEAPAAPGGPVPVAIAGAQLSEIAPTVVSTAGMAAIVVAYPPPSETWLARPLAWDGPEGAHYDTLRFFTSSESVYLGVEAQRVSFPAGARMPSAAGIADSYAAHGAPGFTKSTLVARGSSQLATNRGAVPAVGVQGTGTFSNGKPGAWRARIAVVDRMVFHTIVSSTEGILESWVRVPAGYQGPVARQWKLKGTEVPSLVTQSAVVGLVEASTVFIRDSLDESAAVRAARSIVTGIPVPGDSTSRSQKDQGH